MQITIQRANSAACVCIDTPDPSADATGYAEDWAGAAALLGVTQAEARRRACRSFADCVAAAAALPAAKEVVLRSRGEIGAELKRERGEKVEAVSEDAELKLEAEARLK